MANTAVETLNTFLRGEISAVETYRQALDKLGSSSARTELEECRRSHQQRVEKLREQVVRMGGQPDKGSGAWGGFAKLVEGGATVFGEKAAIAALEEGEDHGMKLYKDDMEKLDPASRTLVEQDLFPAQQRTHKSLSTLKHSIH